MNLFSIGPDASTLYRYRNNRLMLTSLQTSTIAIGTAPDWIHLVPSGTFKGADGRGPYTVLNPAAVMAISMQEGKLCVDVNHSTDLAAPHGQPSPAIGWIDEMQQRPDGIWGHVEWTPAGRSLFAEKAYRGISPVLAHDNKNARAGEFATEGRFKSPPEAD